ncbi:hypothetical protein PK35_07490 [Tamlana nanhaiensis]|uniref:Fn3-like domain-containing protein n=1 Tax=Neotamlana nanhaiensis TaxID=1382798 RepID=A0A0D7W4U8_9FLAO|nr:hypothetical protein [Tamlana nanhaiensis]KJD32817.1 hypothetical protein PK35_07490 [Tamlana nanhaiensis]
MKPFTIILFTFLSVLPLKKQTYFNTTIQNCEATLKVVKDRNAKSVFGDRPTKFDLTLTNTSASRTTFKIYTEKSKESCGKNSYLKSSSKKLQNEDLNVSFVNPTTGKTSQDKSSGLNEFTLNAGESKTFEIFVQAKEDTPYYSWGCIDVKAESASCNSIIATTKLSIYIPDPTEE